MDGVYFTGGATRPTIHWQSKIYTCHRKEGGAEKKHRIMDDGQRISSRRNIQFGGNLVRRNDHVSTWPPKDRSISPSASEFDIVLSFSLSVWSFSIRISCLPPPTPAHLGRNATQKKKYRIYRMHYQTNKSCIERYGQSTKRNI